MLACFILNQESSVHCKNTFWFCRIFFEIRKFKDIHAFSKGPIQAILRVSILPDLLHNSTLEFPKIVYICQDACSRKLQCWIFVQISLISNELLVIIKMKNIVKIIKLIPQKWPKVGSWKYRPLYLNLHISKNMWQIGDAMVSKSKFIHTLLESKNIFVLE